MNSICMDIYLCICTYPGICSNFSLSISPVLICTHVYLDIHKIMDCYTLTYPVFSESRSNEMPQAIQLFFLVIDVTWLNVESS